MGPVPRRASSQPERGTNPTGGAPSTGGESSLPPEAVATTTPVAAAIKYVKVYEWAADGVTSQAVLQGSNLGCPGCCPHDSGWAS